MSGRVAFCATCVSILFAILVIHEFMGSLKPKCFYAYLLLGNLTPKYISCMLTTMLRFYLVLSSVCVCVQIDASVQELEAAIEELGRKRDEERGGALKKLETAVVERQKEDAKTQSNLTHKKEALKAEQKKLKDINKTSASVRTLGLLLACLLQVCMFSFCGTLMQDYHNYSI